MRQQILRALKKGDVSAFDSLFSEYGKRLYFFAFGYLKSKEEAEEVVQEVFYKVWKNRRQLKPELSFKSYLFTIAYHHIVELYEKNDRKQHYKHTILNETISFDNDTVERLDYQFLLEKVEKLITKLPNRQREILHLRKKEGVPVKQIAAQLNISHKTVENHLTEAIKSLKKGLDNEELAIILLLYFSS